MAMRQRLTAGVLCVVAGWLPTNAAEIVHQVAGSSGSGVIFVHGELQQSDADTFNKIAQLYNRASVFLSSGGGNLISGIRIGTVIRMRNFSTAVPPAAICASACAMAWLGGTQRFMSPNARVGFHAAFVIENGNVRETGLGNAIVGAYLTQLGLPMSAVIYITRSDPSSMTWLSPGDARNYGIDVKYIETNKEHVPQRDLRSADEGQESIDPPATSRKEFALTGTESWLIIASRRERDDAIAIAREYGMVFRETTVFESENGFFAVSIGRIDTNKQDKYLESLKEEKRIPVDAYYSKGTRFTRIAWKNQSSSGK